MPCYTVKTISVDLSVANRVILAKAINTLGWAIAEVANATLAVTTPQGSFTIANGKAVVASNLVPLVNQLRMEYSRAGVNHLARKHGWQKQAVGVGKYRLTKGV